MNNIIMKYIQSIINEGKYDLPVNNIARDILNALKSGKTKLEIEYYDVVKKDHVITLISRFKKSKTLPFPFDISLAESDDENIWLTIIINPTQYPQLLNNLLAEIKEVLRHEIEHVSQYVYPGKEQVEPPENMTYEEYFLLPYEIPAFVRGFYTKAKTQKVPIDQVIDEYLNGRIKLFKDPKNKSKVRRAWIKYAKENLPKAQFSR